MLTPGDCEKFMSSDGYRELLSLGIILAAVVFFSNHVLSYAQELPAKTDSISDITSEIAIPTATSSVQQQTPQEQFITPGLSSRGDQDNSIRNLPLEPETQEKATDLTMIQQKKKGTLTEQQIDNQELSKDIVSDKKQQLDKIMKDSLTESKSTLQPEDSEEKQQDEYSDDGNTDSEDQEEIQHDERVNEEEENNNRQNNNDKDDNNNGNIPLELPIPFP
jgi:5'-3' exonuclease